MRYGIFNFKNKSKYVGILLKVFKKINARVYRILLKFFFLYVFNSRNGFKLANLIENFEQLTTPNWYYTVVIFKKSKWIFLKFLNTKIYTKLTKIHSAYFLMVKLISSSWLLLRILSSPENKFLKIILPLYLDLFLNKFSRNPSIIVKKLLVKKMIL